MISILLNIVETNDNDGIRNPVLTNDLLSVDSFDISGGSTSKRIKMLSSTVIKISDLVELNSVTSISIVSKSNSNKVYPLFDISTLDSSGDVQSSHRGCVYMIGGVQGLTADLQIDNCEVRGDNPEISILITTKI